MPRPIWCEGKCLIYGGKERHGAFRKGLQVTSDVDCSTGASPPLYIRRGFAADLHSGGVGDHHHPKDIFPNIDIPVISVIWSYTGLTPDDMEKRMVTITERAMTTTVNDIEHMESQSYSGIADHQGVLPAQGQAGDGDRADCFDLSDDLTSATAGNHAAYRHQVRRILRPSIAARVVGRGTERTATLRPRDSTSCVPNWQPCREHRSRYRIGGKQRNIMVDIDPNQLYAKHLSPADISAALNQQNLILPAGTAKIGDREYQVALNSSPTTVAAMNDLPVRAANGAVVTLKDVAQVRDGYIPQTNIVRTNGSRSALLSVLKNGQASTLDIVAQIKAALPRILSGLPANLKVTPLFDQSIFVRASIYGVLREAVIAAFLTGMMILLFPGKLAQHADRLHLHSAGDSDLADHPQRSGTQHQRDDPGRHGIGRRNPGRRRYGGAGKRPPQHGDEEAADARHPRRRFANRGAHLRIYTLHLHCVCARRAADRGRQVSLCAAGHGGRVRHAGLVFPLAHPGAHDGALHARAGGADLCRGRGRTRGAHRGPELGVASALQVQRLL